MKKVIEKILPKSEFGKNTLTLITGTTVAQIIPIAISPILTRLYSPNDFGIFTLFLSISLILGSISNGRYETAVMLPRKEEDALSICFLGVIVTFFTSLLTFIIIFLFHDDLILLLNNKSIGGWLYVCPILILLIGVYNILLNYNNRKKHYKDIAKANVYKSSVMSGIQLLFPIVKSGSGGLILGYLFSQVSSNMQLVKNIFLQKENFKHVKKERILSQGRKYQKFPKFSMPATLANTMSIQFLNILILSFFGATTLGFYSLSQKVLGMPLSVIGGAFSQVFYQKSVEENLKKGSSIDVLSKTIFKLVLIGLPIFTFLFFFIDEIFAFVYGEEWRVAGKYAKILVFMYFSRFLSSTVSQTLSVYGKQEFELLINLVLLISGVLLIYYLKKEFLEFLKYYSLFIGGLYFLFLIYYFKLSKGE